MRLYLMDAARPQTFYDTRPGRWIAEPVWPAPGIEEAVLHLTGEGGLQRSPSPRFSRPVASPADCGMHGGEYCAIYWGPEQPDDQRRDDGLSACWETPPLAEGLDIVGGPELVLRLSADRPRAQVAVRLCDVHPDGASTRISYGLLNLAMRDSQEEPEDVTPGEAREVRVRLDDIAYAMPQGHRLRVAVSSAYWPMVWPSPAAATLTVEAGRLIVPVRPASSGPEWVWEEPEAATPWAVETLREASNTRRIEQDQVTGLVTLVIEDDFGAVRDLDHGLVNSSRVRERWVIHPDDPLSARGEAWWEQENSRGDWSVRTEAFTEMVSDATSFTIRSRVTAWEGGVQVHHRDDEDVIPRLWV